MPEFLLELFSEEIPARMQAAAAEALATRVGKGLDDAGLDYGTMQSYVTPRRLTLVVADLAAAEPDLAEDRRGPRVGAPDKAIDGFLRANGLGRDALETRETPKGDFYFARIARKGRPTEAVLAALVPDVVQGFAWPKSMRWGCGRLRWVRPLHRLLCLFDGAVVACAIPDGPAAGDQTEGHRFLAPGPVTVADFADYRAKLRAAKVVLDAEERRAMITEAGTALARAHGFRFRPEPGLLAEVAGLVEWPVVLAGEIDAAFLDVPKEALVTSMQSHQKYFPLFDDVGALAPRFILVANIDAADGGRAIIAGNERVLRARLHDAKFFWDQDRKTPLADRVDALEAITFHARLGSLADKVARVRTLAVTIAAQLGHDAETVAMVERAARLCKADLVTDMVVEFPELQGIMGRYYALHGGEAAPVADAIAAHYAPAGPADDCPSAPVSVAVALAEKIDTLVGFFGIGQPPTGSKDPFALRRAALGSIRLILENGLRLALTPLFEAAHGGYREALDKDARATADNLMAFIADRLKVHLRDAGLKHDLITAVFAVAGESDLVRLTRRAELLGAFLAGDDGANLLTGYRRAANIVRAERQKTGWQDDGRPIGTALLEAPEEQALYQAITGLGGVDQRSLEADAFGGYLNRLADLRAPVDAFFDAVVVNVDDEKIRDNRLKLLNHMTNLLNAVADFSAIEG